MKTMTMNSLSTADIETLKARALNRYHRQYLPQGYAQPANGAVEPLPEPVLIEGRRCQMLFSEAGRLSGIKPNEIATSLVPDYIRETMTAPIVGPVVLVRLPRNPSHRWQLFSAQDAEAIQQVISAREAV